MEKLWLKGFALGLLIVGTVLSGTGTAEARGLSHRSHGFHGHPSFAGRGIRHPGLHHDFRHPGFRGGFHRRGTFL